MPISVNFIATHLYYQTVHSSESRRMVEFKRGFLPAYQLRHLRMKVALWSIVQEPLHVGMRRCATLTCLRADLSLQVAG